MPLACRRATYLLAPLLLLAGCSRTIVDADVSAEVRGRIFRAGGAPVPGAEVRAHVLAPSCTGPSHPEAVRTSDAQGRYSFSISNFGASSQPLCLRLEVLPPAESGLAPATAADRRVDLLPPPGAVLEIDVELAPAAFTKAEQRHTEGTEERRPSALRPVPSV
jgi:hypothetical protein